MPCTCYYDPDDQDKKEFKNLCVALVNKIKELRKSGGPSGCEITNAHTLLDHLYFGRCDEKPNAPIT